MRSSIVKFLILICVVVTASSAQDIPHLLKRGAVTQLIVDGKPFLALAGELDNDASTDLDNLQPIWPMLVRMNLNTVLAPTYWELVEPEEGKFDFTLVDGMIKEARRNNLRLVLLWFASWKNGVSNYAPLWVKKDFKRFPRVQTKDGTALEMFSSIEGYGDATGDADAQALVLHRVRRVHHLREVDSGKHTVIMIQVENEMGVLGDARDRSPAASKAFGGPVPQALMNYLQKHKDTLIPEFRQVWEAAGFKSSGTWEQVFGKGATTDEIFMAWNYARYVGQVAQAGKAEYPLPMFVNAWLYGGRVNEPGNTPSGGPLPHVLDVWRAGAPAIDMLSPDAYNNFVDFCGKYDRSGNPLFIPETNGGAEGAARALYAFGQHGAIGYTPFLIESNPQRDPGNELGRVYKAISQLMPLIAARQGKPSITGVLLEEGETEKVTLGDYTMTASFGAPALRTWSSPPLQPPTAMPPAGAIFVLTAPDEFYVIASGAMTITFAPNTPGPPIVGVGTLDEGNFVDGRWVQGRRLTNYGMKGATGWSGIRPAPSPALVLVPVVYARNANTLGFAGQDDGAGILRVRLYRY